MGCGPSSDTNLAALDMNEMTLTSFVQLEREIAEAEAKSPLKPLELKAEQLVRLSEKMQELKTNLKDLEKQTMKEKADVERLENPDEEIKAAILKLGQSFDEKMAKEKEEYLASLNQQEIVSKELKTTKQQYKRVSSEVNDLEKKAEELQELYKKQDELLGRIFGGEYGSLRENQLENEIDYLEAQRGRILEANFKWRQGQMMLEHACKQLAVAVQKWQNLPAIPQIDLELRYSLATDSRNNVVAAGQNIAGAQRYLEKVDFPYCNPKEVNTLNKAAQYVFTDMQSAERHQHAQECYDTTHKRANALLQWFDTVINTTIMNDLHDINERVKEKTLELRRERVRLIKLKVKEMYGTDLKLDQTLRGRDISANEIAQAMLSDNQVVKVDNEGNKGANTPPLLSKDELAPIPSNSVVFGNMYDNFKNQIEQLAQQHQDELQTFLKEQQLNQEKIKGSLEEKLMARRQRRARIKLEESQRLSLQS